MATIKNLSGPLHTVGDLKKALEQFPDDLALDNVEEKGLHVFRLDYSGSRENSPNPEEYPDRLKVDGYEDFMYT